MDEEDEGISSKLVERDRYARNLGEKVLVVVVVFFCCEFLIS